MISAVPILIPIVLLPIVHLRLDTRTDLLLRQVLATAAPILLLRVLLLLIRYMSIASNKLLMGLNL